MKSFIVIHASNAHPSGMPTGVGIKVASFASDIVYAADTKAAYVTASVGSNGARGCGDAAVMIVFL
jgi:hypothetical protein